MKVAYITNSPPKSGVGHRAAEVARRLRAMPAVRLHEFHLDGRSLTAAKDGVVLVKLNQWPGWLGSKTAGWLRLGRVIKKEIRPGEYDLVHLTNQTLSWLAGSKMPTVVTVHDLIELEEPQSKGARLISRCLYRGVKKADVVVAVSKYTAGRIRSYFNLPAGSIKIVPNGVGPQFHQLDGFEQSLAGLTLRHELGIEANHKVVLYVGSDHPRKNVIGAVRAFARARQRWAGLVFVKVGLPGLPAGRERLLREIDRLGLRDSVRFVGSVSMQRLNELYNLARVLVYPSRHEGFGLPPLQAFAAGLPVVCSHAASLPEVTGQAALVRDPDDIEGLARDLLMVLKDERLAQKLRAGGWQRARLFSWDKAAVAIRKIYDQLV